MDNELARQTEGTWTSDMCCAAPTPCCAMSSISSFRSEGAPQRAGGEPQLVALSDVAVSCDSIGAVS